MEALFAGQNAGETLTFSHVTYTVMTLTCHPGRGTLH